ncbi:MAG: hypothetical protein JWO46_3260, partial [Nocardioidaceae bacterium]|nr:hypothetical protein [Nocardioidaceae bacterium]
TVASVNVPHRPSGAALVAWWSQAGNRTSGVVSGCAAFCAAALLLVVVDHVRGLAASASPAWSAMARSAGVAFGGVMLVTAAARAAIAHLVDVMDEPLPGADVLRYATALNYVLLGFAAMGMLAVTILCVSTAVLRSGVLGRWVGYVGLGCGALILVTVVAQYGSYTVPLALLWALCLSVAIARGGSPRAR